MKDYIVAKDDYDGAIIFLVGTRWSNEFPDSEVFSLAEAKRLAKVHAGRVFNRSDYGTDQQRVLASFDH